MIFLDTCIWFELLGVRTPEKPHEIKQTMAATEFFQKVLESEEKIVTCEEQLLELIKAIEKATMKSVNRERKAKNASGIGNLKEFRRVEEFQRTKMLCKSVVSDVKHFAKLSDIGNYDIESILGNLDLADINDCLYYNYCEKKQIDFYTFDSDLKNLSDTCYLHLLT